MNLLPPFFKFARRIDKAEIIEFMYARLATFDEYGNGFVGSMFRNILVTEVNLKEKIVDDFVANLKPNPLDYNFKSKLKFIEEKEHNLTTHTMQSKTDYLLLVAKLFGYLAHLGLLPVNEQRVVPSPVIQAVHMLDVPEERRCTLSVSIEVANNVKNPCQESSPPNTYVCFRSPFETADVELRTPVIYRTTFPQWNYTHSLKDISILRLCSTLLNHDLQFDIYHKKLPTEGKFSNQESVLIGYASVDASNLVKDQD